jgi:hypothetical protein
VQSSLATFEPLAVSLLSSAAGIASRVTHNITSTMYRLEAISHGARVPLLIERGLLTLQMSSPSSWGRSFAHELAGNRLG